MGTTSSDTLPSPLRTNTWSYDYFNKVISKIYLILKQFGITCLKYNILILFYLIVALFSANAIINDHFTPDFHCTTTNCNNYDNCVSFGANANRGDHFTQGERYNNSFCTNMVENNHSMPNLGKTSFSAILTKILLFPQKFHNIIYNCVIHYLVDATKTWLSNLMKYNFIQLILLIIIIFRINDKNTLVNESQYIPKSKRNWKTGWKTKLHYIMENVITKLDARINKEGKTRPFISTNIKQKKYKRSNKYKRVIAYTTLVIHQTEHALAARITPSWGDQNNIVGIDNRCSGCISHKACDFIGELKDCKRNIKGFGGTRNFSIKIGTIKWHVEDDLGKIHKFVIPNSYYIPEGGVRLLSPQHWAQTQKDIKPIIGTKEVTDHESTTLYWNQLQYKKTVKISKHNNVSTFQLAPSFREFEAYEAKAGFKDDENSIITDELNISNKEMVPYIKPVNPWKEGDM